MNYRIFYAWQSQNKKTERYIKSQLKNAKKSLKKEGIEIKLIFSPTQDKTGSPDIKSSIFEQIKECDIFVGDLSFIDTKNNISNGNVLYEIGIADAFLGEERVILLCDENTKIEDIVFDINHKRISKVNTKQKESEMAFWIKDALEEADKQRFIKNYATSQYEDDLIILFNYFYKYVNMTKKHYGDEIAIPSLDMIRKELKKSKFPYFFLNLDFSTLIKELENKLVRMSAFSHKRIIWYILNIITQLSAYQKFCSQLKYSFVKIKDEVTEQFNVYDVNNFFLKEIESFSYEEKGILFINNLGMYIGENGTYILDKRTFIDSCKYYRVGTIPIDEGAQSVIVSKTGIIDNRAIETISQLVLNILVAIKEYLDFSNLTLQLETDSLITIK